MSDSRTHMTLWCYHDSFGYGWHHVDLFMHDPDGREVDWVHWQVTDDGPEAADRATAQVEPMLSRVSDWRHSVSESGMDYWVADAEWAKA